MKAFTPKVPEHDHVAILDCLLSRAWARSTTSGIMSFIQANWSKLKQPLAAAVMASVVATILLRHLRHKRVERELQILEKDASRRRQ